jgi:hypothetical protein
MAPRCDSTAPPKKLTLREVLEVSIQAASALTAAHAAGIIHPRHQTRKHHGTV